GDRERIAETGAAAHDRARSHGDRLCNTTRLDDLDARHANELHLAIRRAHSSDLDRCCSNIDAQPGAHDDLLSLSFSFSFSFGAPPQTPPRSLRSLGFRFLGLRPKPPLCSPVFILISFLSALTRHGSKRFVRPCLAASRLKLHLVLLAALTP